jgi:predicted Fe-Mo cluster-binding NifX family protein
MKHTEMNPTTRVALPVLKDAGLASRVSKHFGKSKGFIIVDSNGENCEYLDTEKARLGHECAPIRALAEHGCRALLCHSMGRGALRRSHEAGFHIYKAAGGNLVVDVLDDFRSGRCPDLPDSALCSHHHGHDGEHEHDH